jgi:HPt (histidine-containing phosphotransfer) domain-containing protein
MSESEFDKTCFDALVDDLGEEAAGQILCVFFADTRGNLDRLQTIAADGNGDQVARHAHSIKSAAAAFGFNHLSVLARDLEGTAPQLGAEDLSTRVGGLCSAFAKICAQLSLPDQSGQNAD